MFQKKMGTGRIVRIKVKSDRKKAISGMTCFDIATDTLPTIGLECPIWLIGIK